MTLTWDRLVTVDRLKLYPGCDANHSDNELEVSYTAMDIDGNVIGSGKKVATGLDGSFAEIQLEEPLTGVKSIRFQTLPVIDKGGDAYGMREAMVFGEFEADKPIASLKPVTVNTYVGRAPKLPETVEATHENGLTSNPAVVWDAIDPALYAESGSFTVEGTVEGTELKAVATVYVAPASAATIEAGMLELHLDGLGQVTGLYVDGEDFLTTEPDGKLMPLVSLMVKDHERVNPTAMTYDSENKVLDFTFEAINVHALISLQDKGNYTSLTLTEVQNPDHVRIEAILWGPVKTTINTGGQTVGTAYNDEYAIGMHMLNLKTVGGWPIELDAKNECYHSDLPLKNGHTDPRSNRQPHTNTAVFATWAAPCAAIPGITPRIPCVPCPTIPRSLSCNPP